MQLSTIINAQVGDRVNIAKPNEKPRYITVTLGMKKQALDFYQKSKRADSTPVSTPETRALGDTAQITDDVTNDTPSTGLGTPTAAEVNQRMQSKINDGRTLATQTRQQQDAYKPANAATAGDFTLDAAQTPPATEPASTQADYARAYAINQRRAKESAQAAWDAERAAVVPEAQVDTTSAYPPATFDNVANAKPGDWFMTASGKPVQVWAGDISWAKGKASKAAPASTKPSTAKPSTAKPAESAKPAASAKPTEPRYKEDKTLVESIRKDNKPDNSVKAEDKTIVEAIRKAKPEREVSKQELDAKVKADEAYEKKKSKSKPKSSGTSSYNYTPTLGNGLPTPPADWVVSDDRMKNILAGVRPPEYTLYRNNGTDSSIDNIVNSING